MDSNNSEEIRFLKTINKFFIFTGLSLIKFTYFSIKSEIYPTSKIKSNLSYRNLQYQLILQAYAAPLTFFKQVEV